MALDSLASLGRYSRTGKMPTGYPYEEHVTLYSPDDNVHGALLELMHSAEQSLVWAMYGFDDDELSAIILDHLNNDHLYVSLSLDSTQAAGKHETALLKAADYPSNSIAFGQSRGHAIMHLKQGVIDGIDVVGGSTNWSTSGETKQDNELTVTRHPVVAFHARTQLDLIHEAMLTQMAAKAKRSSG